MTLAQDWYIILMASVVAITVVWFGIQVVKG